MANVLEKIVADKRIEVEAMKKSLPLENFVNGLTPSTKDMYAALDRSQGKSHAGFILECKKASPSKGLIRPDFDVKEIASIYNKYAAAISVLTDEKYFQGTHEYLKQVTEIVDCPVLNKDFFVDTYQVHLARYYGADAILLMLSVLTDEEYKELEAVAVQHNLAILTEISNEEEKERAIALGAKLIGINNRNLRDLSTDIARTFEFSPTLPDDRIVISESGIYTNDQVRELAPAVDGFLVGSSIMAEDDIDLACRKLIYGKNKVCGLSEVEHAQAAADSGSVFGGLIFVGKSPRCVDLKQAKEIVSSVPSLQYVGVFVDESIDTVTTYAKALDLFAVQLHGNESQTYIDELITRLSGKVRVWKAVAVEDEIPTFPGSVSNIVMDGKNAGSGNVFRWPLLAESQQDFTRCFLAGGLKSENIYDAITQMTAHDLFGLDINSGVETEPGKKSREKIEQLFAQIRDY